MVVRFIDSHPVNVYICAKNKEVAEHTSNACSAVRGSLTPKRDRFIDI